MIGIMWISSKPKSGLQLFFNLFVSSAPFLYHITVFWWFQEVEKGSIGNKWVKIADEKSLGNRLSNIREEVILFHSPKFQNQHHLHE